MLPLLQIEGLHKAYNVPVLIDFDFELNAGEIHALMGSNGAGKSTLANIICGLTRAEVGNMRLASEGYSPASKSLARKAGVVMVMQELNLIPTLSVAENLFFHDLPSRFGVIDQKRLRANAKKALTRVRLESLDPDTPVGELGVGQQQLLEIAAALAQQCRVLILDEPTAALTDPEIATLFQQMRQLAAEGVAMIYISHRMDEIRTIADRVTVMRDGRRISTHDSANVDTTTLVQEMAGKEGWRPATVRRDLTLSPVVLEARGVASLPVVKDLNLAVRRGEIVGIAGLVGSGRTESLQTLFGVNPITAGEVKVHGKPMRFQHPRDAVVAGIGMVPEDRKTEALLLDHSIRLNAGLATMDAYSQRGLLASEKERSAVAVGQARLEIKFDDQEQAIRELSGGNQQKIVMLRWLLRDSEILLLDEPTRGIDVAAKAGIHAVLRELAGQGRAIVVVSSELIELMALCDRIVVLAQGRTGAEFTPDTWSQEALTAAAFGEPHLVA